jgi:hypothetical protein
VPDGVFREDERRHRRASQRVAQHQRLRAAHAEVEQRRVVDGMDDVAAVGAPEGGPHSHARRNRARPGVQAPGDDAHGDARRDCGAQRRDVALVWTPACVEQRAVQVDGQKPGRTWGHALAG